MISYPSFEEVSEAMGDKVIAGLSKAAAATASDLREYRRAHPLWVAQSSERGLASWIHDRLWVHVVGELDELPHVSMIDKEPRRELFVGHNYRLRVKRHHGSGSVSTYPTLTALEFMSQGSQLVLDGLEEIRLITGYLWDPDEREVSAPVLSLRDGQDKIVWMRELPPAEGGSGVLDLTSPTPETGPVAPVIEVSAEPRKGVDRR